MIPEPLRETLEWLHEVEDFRAAQSLTRSIHKYLDPKKPTSSYFLAENLFRAKDFRGAALAATQALELDPHSSELKFNAAIFYNAAGDSLSAERLIRSVLRERPDFDAGWMNLGLFLLAQGQESEAVGIFQNLCSRLPEGSSNSDIAKYNLACYEIRNGNFKLGLKHLAKGRRLKLWGATNFSSPKPSLTPGADLRGKNVLVVSEGGSGDELIAVRFCQSIRDRGGRVTWYSVNRLSSLITRSPGVERVSSPPAELAPPNSYDYWVRSMDLPLQLDLDISEIPNAPYIFPSPEFRAKWAPRISAQKKLKVGIRWRGNVRFDAEEQRRVPFCLMERLGELSGIELYSLQRDEGTDDLQEARLPISDFGSRFESWEDTAAAISHLDLVITSCTSIAHLAGAMGKRTWVLVPLMCYYIWATPGDRSPWYPSVRLFRQERYASWAEPCEKIMARLRQGEIH